MNEEAIAYCGAVAPKTAAALILQADIIVIIIVIIETIITSSSVVKNQIIYANPINGFTDDFKIFYLRFAKSV